MQSTDRFQTGVVGSDGIWSKPREWMSYSSLVEVEECPRRWMLRRASYPGIWDHSGYPDAPSVPALLGDAVHAALELMIGAFVDNGCNSPHSECAVDALKQLGGYTAVVSSTVEARLANLDSNPRVEPRLSDLRRSLHLRLPEIRQRVQAAISRTGLVPQSTLKASTDTAHVGRQAVSIGSHAEIELRAHELRWTGRADLITVSADGCEIVDYKTGAPSDSHADQLRIYALLWFRDRDLNPSAQLATRLVLRYPAHDVPITAPDRNELGELEKTIASRTAAALSAISKRPPEARPSASTCEGCSVRQLCGEYWQFLARQEVATPQASTDETRFSDMEVHVLKRNGARSWNADIVRGPIANRQQAVILRTPTEVAGFESGARVRVLNGAVGKDSDSGLDLLTITSGSEVFLLKVGSK